VEGRINVEEGRNHALKEERKERKKEGRIYVKEGRKKTLDEGRNERRNEGRKEGRKGGSPKTSTCHRLAGRATLQGPHMSGTLCCRRRNEGRKVGHQNRKEARMEGWNEGRKEGSLTPVEHELGFGGRKERTKE